MITLNPISKKLLLLQRNELLSEKQKWLRKNVSVSPSKIHLVKRRQKQNYATDSKGKPNILIDDFISNINDFKRRGGIGIYHKTSFQTISALKKLGF